MRIYEGAHLPLFMTRFEARYFVAFCNKEDTIALPCWVSINKPSQLSDGQTPRGFVVEAGPGVTHTHRKGGGAQLEQV